MLRLLLVRHGQTEWNAQRRYQGHTDLPLNEEGRKQARQLAERLASQKIDLVFSSDLQRARQTAQALVDGRELQVQADSRLREMNFGVLEGHTFEEGLEHWPEMIQAWVDDNNQPPEGGERFDDFCGRVLQFFGELFAENQDKTILVVAHGGPLRVILQDLLEVPETVWFNLEHASLTEIGIDGETILINRLNDTGSVYT